MTQYFAAFVAILFGGGSALASDPVAVDYFLKNSQIPAFIQTWYARHLQAMEERPLRDAVVKEGYRLLIMPAFRNAISIRLEPTASGAVYRVVELDRSYSHESAEVETPTSNETHAGASLGRIINERQGELSADQWESLYSVLSSDFWTWPTLVKRRGVDGEDWVLEGYRLGKYHVVDRWSPLSSPFRSLCEKLRTLTEPINGGE